MVVGQKLLHSFLSLSFKLYVVAPASELPDSDLGALFYTHGRTPLHGGRPAIFILIFGHGRPARVSGWPTRWGGRPATSQKVPWPASFLLSSSFQLSRYFFKISPPSGGYFGRERLPPFPSPFTSFLAYLKGWTAPLPRLENLISRPSLPKPPFSYSKTLKTFKLPSSTLHQP